MAYVQCELRKEGRVEVSYIPQKFAQTGRILELKNNGTWENGWVVASVYGPPRSDEDVLANRDNYKYHRNNTDV